MALIKCRHCGGHMGVGVFRCIYCGKPVDAKSPIIGTDHQDNSLTEVKQEPASKTTVNVLWITGVSLAGIGSVLSTTLPVIGIPTVFAGGLILLKANQYQKK